MHGACAAWTSAPAHGGGSCLSCPAEPGSAAPGTLGLFLLSAGFVAGEGDGNNFV